MLDVRLTLYVVRRVFGVVLPIEVRWYKRFSFTGRQVVCWADMNPLATDKQLGKAMKAVNPLNTPVLGDFYLWHVFRNQLAARA